jgi:hypothetical protein
LRAKLEKAAPYSYVGDGGFNVVDGEILEIEPEKIDARALENLEPRCEMLLDAGEVTLPGTCNHENAMRHRETSGTAFAKGKFKCLFGKRIGSREVARGVDRDPSPRDPTEELAEVAGLLGQRCHALGRHRSIQAQNTRS